MIATHQDSRHEVGRLGVRPGVVLRHHVGRGVREYGLQLCHGIGRNFHGIHRLQVDGQVVVSEVLEHFCAPKGCKTKVVGGQTVGGVSITTLSSFFFFFSGTPQIT